MRRGLFLSVLVTLALSCEGPQGDVGPAGPEGPEGPPGPITEPPRVTELAPQWGSAYTHVTLTGENFGASPTVWVDGVEATVISAKDTEIVVEPALAVDAPQDVVVNVETANQMSNGMGFELVPSGYPGPSGILMPVDPVDVAIIGTTVYVASGSPLHPNSGVYAMDAGGWVQRVWAAPKMSDWIFRADLEMHAYDAANTLAVHGDELYIGTVFGSVLRYDPATGRTTEIMAPMPWFGIDLPGIDGLAFDGEDLYVLDKATETLWHMAPDGGMTETAWLYGWDDMTTDGDSLYLANGDANAIQVIELDGTPDTAVDYVIGAEGVMSVDVVGGQVVYSDDQGRLFAYPLHQVGEDDGGSATVFGDAQGYGYRVLGMYADATHLYLAQDRSGAVRRMALADTTTAETLVAGARVHFGIIPDGDGWFLSGIGPGIFELGPGYAPDTIQDGAIVQIDGQGRSRVVMEAAFPAGMVDNGDGTLTVGDCFEGTLAKVSVADGVVENLVEDLGCVGGLYRTANGDLYYANAWIPELAAATMAEPLPEPEPVPALPGFVGRYTAAGVNTPDYISGLPPIFVHLTGDGDTLLMTGLGMASGDLGYTAIYTADAAVGGAADLLVPAPAAGAVVSIGVSPLGSVYAARFPVGDLVEVDLATGDVLPFGNAAIGWVGMYGGEGPGISAPAAMGFLGDGTLVLPDFAQAGIVYAAP